MLLAFFAAAQPLAPTGKWMVEYDKDMCVLSRTYAGDGGPVTLGLRPYPMGTETEVVLLTPDNAAETMNGKAGLSLLPAGTAATGTFARYHLPGKPGRLSTLTFKPEALAGIEGATAITIQLGKESYTLALPTVANGMRALSACQADLLRTWGIDPAERESMVSAPKANLVTFFGPDAYPSDAQRANQQGKTIAVAVVDQDGRVKSCVVASTSGSPSLDQATCRIIQTRARFSPAVDKDGKPATAHVVVPVRWVLPQ